MPEAIYGYSLRFRLTTARTNRIIVGLLELLCDGVQINSYRASSSYAGKQYWGSWREKGGLIPRDEPWIVHLEPLDRSYNPAIGKTAYKITPFEVETIGATRGDFMFHDDANRATAPGTLGCIFPISQAGWAAIQRDFAMIKAKGIDTIPLDVEYLK
jgi:hypothetical protein